MGKGARLRAKKKETMEAQIHKAATAVAQVIVRCPETDKFFPTGVACDPSSFSTATFENNSSQCSYCGKMHRWGDSEIALDN